MSINRSVQSCTERGLRIVLALTLIILPLVSGTVHAAPELISASASLQGALIPGGEIIFTAEGTPGCVATLTLTIQTTGSSTPLTWSARMQEEDNGLYLYRWTTWDGVEITLSSATVQLANSSGEQSPLRRVIDSPISVGGEIIGRVTDQLTGTPLPEILVMAYSPSTRHFARATSNRRGEFELAGLGTASDYRIWTTNDLGYTETKREKIRVTAGYSTNSGDLTLSGLAAVSGYLEDETATPIPWATVTAAQAGGAEQRSAITDEQGHYTIIGLPPGDYELRTSADVASAATEIEVKEGKVTNANFRLIMPQPVPEYEIVFPHVVAPTQAMYWPSQGGPVSLVPVSETGTAILRDLTTGQRLVLSLQEEGELTYYTLYCLGSGSYTMEPHEQPAEPSATITPQLTVSPPLTTRGGSVLLSGRATGMKWVDLWLDGCWEARLPIHAGSWQTIINLDQGEHQITVMAVGNTAPRKVEQQIVVRRSAPAVLQIKINQQPHPSLFSGDGGGEINSAPKQPLTVSLTTTQAGTTNWLVLGDRQWVMGKQGDIVTTTIPTDAMIEGEHPLTWRWERQGVRGEVPLGTVNVRKPTIWTVIDAITGEPVSGMNARVEQQASLAWEASPISPHVTNDRGQVNIWLDDKTDYRLRLTKPGYQGKLIPIDPTSRTQETVIYLTPTRPSGPISISPGRDARDVDTSATITVAFARDLAPKSVNSDTFYIQGVNAKVSYDPLSRKATLEPIGRLADNSHYLVHLSGEIRYADGTPLGRGLWWLISTADHTSEEERSSASKLTPVGQAATLAPKDSSAKAIIPAGSSPVQTLYRLTRPSTLPKALPGGWKAVAAPLNFAAINSPLDKPIHMLQQGVEISIFYTDPPAEGQAVTLWRYDNSAQSWVEHSHDHDLELRTVRFATDRPGIFVFSKAN